MNIAPGGRRKSAGRATAYRKRLALNCFGWLSRLSNSCGKAAILNENSRLNDFNRLGYPLF